MPQSISSLTTERKTDAILLPIFSHSLHIIITDIGSRSLNPRRHWLFRVLRRHKGAGVDTTLSRVWPIIELELREKRASASLREEADDAQLKGLRSTDDLRGHVKHSPQTVCDEYLRDAVKSTVMNKSAPN